ncbi:MAG: sodium-dependent bicarbonate transport family permease [Pyrinomonadaceae bacterium]|nr:sodium-dependent bicarbonate transport family permease [Pyrinomonadaceae bacterium]
MDFNLLISNFLNPPILFFFLGLAAVFVKSDLEIPAPIPKILSLYLLFAIGYKGGVGLAAGGLQTQIVVVLVAAVVMATFVPLYAFFVLRRKLPVADAAAIAATYGSISAVTFITAAALLEKLGIAYGGYMVAAMALMESPAIIVAVLLYRLSSVDRSGAAFSWRELCRAAFFNGSVFLIMGSLVIGALSGDAGAKTLKPFTNDIFAGGLCFFLLDMGIVAAKRLGDLRRAGAFLTAFAILLPLINAALAIPLAYVWGLSQGDAFMFTILCASASYIAVPAAMRLSIPEANPSLYVPMSLAITFPFNIIAGMSLYLAIINYFWS